MNIELKIDENYNEPKIIIYTNQITDDLSHIIDIISNTNRQSIYAYKNNKMYILNQNDIESIYSENSKIYARCNNEIYTIKNRLYELDQLLDRKKFIRISNSEIINFYEVSNIDFKVFGTLIISFKSGNISYASRRYIPKIKEFLKI